MDPIAGILLIALGSIGAASFYVPFKKVKSWAWESYWISQGFFAWIIIPWIFALIQLRGFTNLRSSLRQMVGCFSLMILAGSKSAQKTC